jgi:hypothetical protein
MRKTVAVYLCLLLLLVSTNALASEELKNMTMEQLLALRSDIENELMSREGDRISTDPAPTTLTAEEIVKKISDAGFPIHNVIVYTEDTDPNNQLGRPHGYTSKVNFADKRCEQYDASDPEGGNFEVFGNTEDCSDRKKYLESVYETSPQLRKYIYQFENVLFRLSYELRPAQAEDYKIAVISILTNIPIKPYKK